MYPLRLPFKGSVYGIVPFSYKLASPKNCRWHDSTRLSGCNSAWGNPLFDQWMNFPWRMSSSIADVSFPKRATFFGISYLLEKNLVGHFLGWVGHLERECLDVPLPIGIYHKAASCHGVRTVLWERNIKFRSAFP